MSAHRLLSDLYLDGTPHEIPDPGDAGTLNFDRQLSVFSLVSAAAETRTLPDPKFPGQRALVYLKTDGGDVTITADTQIDSAGTTSIVLGDAGDYVDLVGVNNSTSLEWRVVSSEGVADVGYVPLTGLIDDQSLNFGTGDDVSVNWNGSYLESNAAANAMWDNAPSPLDPNGLSDSFSIVDDFFKLDTTATVGGWVNDAVGTGTVTLADDVAGGVAVLTCQATTDNASEQLAHVSAPFKLAAGKTIWFECRLKLVGDITQSEVSFGLAALGEDLTAVADVKPNDGIAFTKQDAATTFTLTASKDGTNTGEVASVDTLVNNTYVTYGLLIDGVTSVTPYIDGVAGTAATATIPDDESLAPYFLVRNGDATTQEVLHVDYVKVVQLR